MALKIWMSLNKDFRNNGLENVEASVYGTAAINTATTRGTALYFGTTSANGSISFPASLFTGYTEITVAFFVNFLSFDADYSCIFGLFKDASGYVNASKVFCFGKTTNTTGTTGIFELYGSDLGTPSVKSNSFGVNTWQHFALTYSNKTLTVFQNGVKVASSAYTNAINFSATQRAVFGQSISNNNRRHCNCQMADLRIYDHALSNKEVKEISKGLVQHIKLNESIGQTDLIKGKTLSSYNNHGTGMTCTSEMLNETYMGMPVQRWTYTPKNSSCVNGFKGSSYSARGVRTSSTTYFGETGTTIPFVYWIYYRPITSGVTAGGTASNIGGWTSIAREYVGNGWYRVGQRRTGNNHASRTSDYIYTSLLWPYAAIDSSCTVDFTVPGHLLSGTTDIIENFVEGNYELHDVSGYGNNGTPYGQPVVSAGTPKYDFSTKFDGDDAIIAGRGGMISCEVTVAIWGYMQSWGLYNTRMVSCTEGGGWNFEPSNSKMSAAVAYSGASTGYSHAYDSVTLSNLPSGWHHFAFTFKPGNKICFYRDGELRGSATTIAGKIKYNTSNAVFIGAEAGSNATTPAGNYFNGLLSDYRVYATALSPEDIAELYHTPASIDNKGNFYCGELKET